MTDGITQPTPPLRELARLLPALRPHGRGLAATLLVCVLNQAALVALGTAAAWLVGHALRAGFGELAPVLVLLAGLVIVRTGLTWAEMAISHDLAYRLLAELRVRCFDGLARIAPARLLGRRSGDLAAAALADVEALEFFYAHAVAQVVASVLVLAGGLAALALLDPLLAFAVTPFAALVASVPWWRQRAAAEQGWRVRAAAAALSADVVDTVQGIRELSVFRAFGRRRALLRARNQELAAAQRGEAARASGEAAVTDALVALAVVAVLLVAGLLARDGRIATAWTPAVVALALGVLAPVADSAVQLRNTGTLRAAAQRVFALVDAPAAVPAPQVPRPLGPGPYAVCFEDVWFRYAPDGPDVLRGVTLRIEPGETVALVGPSGAGKTTCASLLLRFWDPTAGRVTLGGVDLRDLADADLRRAVAVVPQEAHLFHGTIDENIRLGRPGAAEDEVAAAARTALVTPFLAGLPDGLDTVVGERGVALSGGQRARVAVARALLTRAPVLILDEAAANLDGESEEELACALDRARAGRTTLVIAHRLSTIRRADRVVVLEAGRVVEQGAFAELVARPDSRLAHLLAHQLGQ
ncbi:HlyB/MsbA family ABC transporter [Carbonactinospora thermoautotrophica]|uniref:HlyB/MsbA family ABC transporter n=2 Tax=Carbonactinospora thermoautotrophica TaxID=1469144 RepID=A0A132MTG5_9ACTN|nr:thiol reductant ABC exporter subunit CydC [Carbonactinospora thermoautotrophica]KWX01010.1 HlyB/MsbA family ABC transporter [Carbonactinospora thermoautotrophica]